MVQKAMKFTPEVMLSAPRRSAGIPNSKGDTILHTSSTYNFENHSKDSVFRVVEARSGAGLDVVTGKQVAGFNWLDDDRFVFLQSEKDGVTSLCVCTVPWDRKTGRPIAEENVHVAGTIDAPAGDLKVTKLDSQDAEFAVVFSAQASSDGTLFNPEKAKKTHSTGRLYSSLYVRHWDRYETKEKNALWHGKLSKNNDGKYELSKVTNLLKGTHLECPIPPFGSTNEFDIHNDTVIFVAKDPDLDPALNTKSNVYVIRIWESGPSPTLEKVEIPGFEGASTSPVIAPDGSKAAFLSMKANFYEADRNEMFILWPLDGCNLTAKQVLSTGESPWSWDRSPSSLCFSADSESLFAVAEECASAKLFMMSADLALDPNIRTLTNAGSVSDVRPLADGTVFISGTTLIDNSFYAVVNPLMPPTTRGDGKNVFAWSNSNSAEGTKFGLSYNQVSSIWTPASNSKILKEIQSIVIRPNKFDSSKKYPVAYAIHGGPQGSWGDNWSTRWNLAVFAEQGYIVVAPNPTGSTGYGQEFTDSIRNNWGGDPYQDIVNCFNWVGENMPEADNERAVALGGSYGGYMVNWIQGHDLGRKFKALMCHDGILSTAGMISTDELYFLFQDIGGTPWYDPSKGKEKTARAQGKYATPILPDWKRWNPSEYLTEWATPELVVHSSKDYRIPISEALAAFNVLQARGVESQFLTFPDENHWVLKPENSLVWHKVVFNWLNKYVGLPPCTTQDPESDEFWGGLRDDGEEVVEMTTQGKVET